MNRLLVFIPTYNEHENVGPLHAELRKLPLDFDILFMDDGSPDGTGKILDDMAAKDPKMKVIHREGKLGIGSAHFTAIRHACEQGYDVLVTMDCDFTHNPADIPRLLEKLSGYDIAVGSRYCNPDSLQGWSLPRKMLTHFGHFLTSNLLGLPQDASGGLRAYDLKRIDHHAFGPIQSRSYSFFFESLYVLIKQGYKVSELPITLSARTYGHSKMSLTEAARSASFLFRLCLENIVNPGRFHPSRDPDRIEPGLSDPQNWEPYWRQKSRLSAFVYEVIATIYRRLIIRPNLERAIRREFRPGSALLHAGCGSGQIDVSLHASYQITALDISLAALELYSRYNPQVHRLEQGSALALHHPDGTFDGVYNLGVVEHFSHEQIETIYREFYRVLKPGGKIVIFWPHRRATSVFVLKVWRYILDNILKKPGEFHPAEPSLLDSEKQARGFLERTGYKFVGYEFGPRDIFIQAVVVGQKPA
ncbi:glycosyltransferase [Prosthecobacter sp.]|uniref:glycosyltransferase n=1 Tax=Prosthecobacter sp. TaxID=1965333 RepID=UPI00378384B0